MSNLLKRALIALGILWSCTLLFMMRQLSQNGRYQTAYGGIILDTRTGATYRINGGVNSPMPSDELSAPIPSGDE